jgi:hypothetical protein
MGHFIKGGTRPTASSQRISPTRPAPASQSRTQWRPACVQSVHDEICLTPGVRSRLIHAAQIITMSRTQPQARVARCGVTDYPQVTIAIASVENSAATSSPPITRPSLRNRICRTAKNCTPEGSPWRHVEADARTKPHLQSPKERCRGIQPTAS